MKQTNILQTIILLLGMLLLTVGCNSDNDGIFRLISESEETVEVGTVTIITHNGSTLFTHTTKGGLQSYDTNTENWTGITAEETPVYYVSTYGTNIYYSARSNEDVNNTLYSFPIAGPYTSTLINSDYDILSMSAKYNLMLTKEGTDDDVKVRKPSDSTDLATYTDHNLNVLLLSQSDDYYLLSGYELDDDDNKEYKNTLYNGADAVTLNGVPDTVGVRAFYADDANANLTVIATDGTVYYDNNFDLSTIHTPASATLVEGEIVSLASTTVPLTSIPVLHKSGDEFFYVQGANGYMFKIDPTPATPADNVVETSFSDISPTVAISSFYYDGTEYYIGTIKNGILKITFP